MMQTIHVLNGDALMESFTKASMAGQCIICRECLIVGPASAIIDDRFWEQRADFIAQRYGDGREKYYRIVVDELSKLKDIQKNDEVNLWFENDLFCQVNYWFTIKLLNQLAPVDNIYRVFPVKSNERTTMSAFGNASSLELLRSFENRKGITRDDLEFGASLWDAYANEDFANLLELALRTSPAFELLNDVVRAHIDRFPKTDEPGRPQKTLLEIIERGHAEFKTVFEEFSRREAIYGFGDSQVKAMLDELAS